MSGSELVNTIWENTNSNIYQNFLVAELHHELVEPSIL